MSQLSVNQQQLPLRSVVNAASPPRASTASTATASNACEFPPPPPRAVWTDRVDLLTGPRSESDKAVAAAENAFAPPNTLNANVGNERIASSAIDAAEMLSTVDTADAWKKTGMPTFKDLVENSGSMGVLNAIWELIDNSAERHLATKTIVVDFKTRNVKGIDEIHSLVVTDDGAGMDRRTLWNSRSFNKKAIERGRRKNIGKFAQGYKLACANMGWKFTVESCTYKKVNHQKLVFNLPIMFERSSMCNPTVEHSAWNQTGTRMTVMECKQQLKDINVEEFKDKTKERYRRLIEDGLNIVVNYMGQSETLKVKKRAVKKTLTSKIEIYQGKRGVKYFLFHGDITRTDVMRMASKGNVSKYYKIDSTAVKSLNSRKTEVDLTIFKAKLQKISHAQLTKFRNGKEKKSLIDTLQMTTYNLTEGKGLGNLLIYRNDIMIVDTSSINIGTSLDRRRNKVVINNLMSELSYTNPDKLDDEMGCTASKMISSITDSILKRVISFVFRKHHMHFIPIKKKKKTTSPKSTDKSKTVASKIPADRAADISMLFKRMYQGLLIYKRLKGDLLVPRAFVVPSEKSWPEFMWGFKLGDGVNAIRTREYLVSYCQHHGLLDLGEMGDYDNEELEEFVYEHLDEFEEHKELVQEAKDSLSRVQNTPERKSTCAGSIAARQPERESEKTNDDLDSEDTDDDEWDGEKIVANLRKKNMQQKKSKNASQNQGSKTPVYRVKSSNKDTLILSTNSSRNEANFVRRSSRKRKLNTFEEDPDVLQLKKKISKILVHIDEQVKCVNSFNLEQLEHLHEHVEAWETVVDI